MNIFILDSDVRESARAACDQHIVKMLTEHAQLICTILDGMGFLVPMRATHKNHPCAVWLREDFANMVYLIMLNRAYGSEYRARFGDKQHAGLEKMETAIREAGIEEIRRAYGEHGADKSGRCIADLMNSPERYVTPPAQVVGENVPHVGKGLTHAVEAYRRLYNGDKRAMLRYRHSAPPAWLAMV